MNTKNTLLATFTVAALTACANGTKSGMAATSIDATNTDVAVTADEAAAKGFEAISVSGSFDVYYMQGEQTSVRLNGDKDDIAHVDIKCDGKTLSVSTKGDGIFGNSSNDVDIYVTSPKLSRIGLAGSGDFKSESDITTESMLIDIAGSGDVNLKSLETGKCTISIAGSGDVSMDHIKTRTLTATIAGSGDIDLQDADIDEAECSTAGSGDIDIDGRVGKHETHIAGSGTVDINN